MTRKTNFVLKGDYVHEEVCPAKQFDPRSFRRVKKSERGQITVGCPTGDWSPKKRRCKTKMRIQNKLVRAELFEARHPTLFKKLERKRGRRVKGTATVKRRRCPR